MFTKLKHLFNGYVFRAKASGMLPFKFDERTFDISWLGWGEYTPKHQRHIIQTLSVKDQKNYNSCVWNATTVQKEVEENKLLSVRSIVAYASKNGYLSGDGFAQIDAGQKVLLKWGIAEQGALNESVDVSFNNYVNVDLSKLSVKASENKILTFWGSRKREERLRLLDEGKTMVTGIDWYTGFNQGGGFEAPWIITKYEGWKVGGHSVLMVGYDLNYFGRKVYIFQNSYSKSWGDNGLFYIDMDFFDKEGYFCFVNLDIPLEEVIQIKLNNMFQKISRAKDGGVWFIKNGGKQKIVTIKQLIGALVDEFGVKNNNMTEAELAKYKDVTFFGN